MSIEELREKIKKGEDVSFARFNDTASSVRDLVLKQGSPLTNASMLKAIRNSDLPEKRKIDMEYQHYLNILNSKNKQACLECYRISNLTFARALEVLNDKSDLVYYKIYLQEKMKRMSKSNEAYKLNADIVTLNNVDFSRMFLAYLPKLNCDKSIQLNCWQENMSVFENGFDNKTLSANDAIWFLTQCPDSIKIPNETFENFEQVVLNSKNGSYNFFFMIKYPNINFRAHEQAILDSKCGMTISQYACEFSVHYAKDFNKVEDNVELANIPACADAIIDGDSDNAVRVFAENFASTLKPEVLNKMYTRLANSQNTTCSTFGKNALNIENQM